MDHENGFFKIELAESIMCAISERSLIFDVQSVEIRRFRDAKTSYDKIEIVGFEDIMERSSF